MGTGAVPLPEGERNKKKKEKEKQTWVLKVKSLVFLAVTKVLCFGWSQLPRISGVFRNNFI